MRFLQKTVSQKYNTVAVPAKLWRQITKLVKASGAYANEAEFVREAIREKLQRVAVTESKSFSEERSRQAIIDYISKQGKAYPSDITADLGIPYFTVTETIRRLVEEGILEPAEER